MRAEREDMMAELIQGLIGQEVRVWSVAASQSYADDGVLIACDGAWLCLRNGANELLYFPIHNIRLLKPHGRPKLDSAL
jgi:hypothetical protein